MHRPAPSPYRPRSAKTAPSPARWHGYGRGPPGRPAERAGWRQSQRSRSLPSFRGQRLMQKVRVTPVVEFEPARIRVRPIVVHPLGHEVALVQLVEEHECPLVLLHIIVDPYFVVRDVLVHVLVPAFGELDIEDAADEPALDDPDLYR